MKEINLKPLMDRVIIEPIPSEEKTKGGIIIPNTAKEKPQKGTIVAIGDGKKDEEMKLNVGDVVLYGKYSGDEIEYNNEIYLIMSQSDIMAIIK